MPPAGAFVGAAPSLDNDPPRRGAPVPWTCASERESSCPRSTTDPHPVPAAGVPRRRGVGALPRLRRHADRSRGDPGFGGGHPAAALGSRRVRRGPRWRGRARERPADRGARRPARSVEAARHRPARARTAPAGRGRRARRPRPSWSGTVRASRPARSARARGRAAAPRRQGGLPRAALSPRAGARAGVARARRGRGGHATTDTRSCTGRWWSRSSPRTPTRATPSRIT